MINTNAKPFLKWAGGKTQLINEIHKNLPEEVLNGKFTYIEPFVGSGAVLFWVLSNFPNLQKAVINDINQDLINTYKMIATKPKELISNLASIQEEFHNLDGNEELKKEYYYKKRDQFNRREESSIHNASLFIFLNRTCFNGLYRVNKRNEFNVPMGHYKKPTICDRENILAVSYVLQDVDILCGDFEVTLKYANDFTLFYFDPPYKPITETSSFNSYAKNEFNDTEQLRLRDFCQKLNGMNYRWILSNSDLKNADEHNNFFDDMYSDFSIQRVGAKRSINSKAEKRGVLNELLITNLRLDNCSTEIV